MRADTPEWHHPSHFKVTWGEGRRERSGGGERSRLEGRKAQPDFLGMISVQLSVSTPHATVLVCSPSLWCHDEWVADERRRGGERKGWERKSDLACASLSLYFIMEITSFTPSTSPFISYCQWQKPIFCLCPGCAHVHLCVKVCVKSHGNRKEAGKPAACRLHMGNCPNEVTPHKQQTNLWKKKMCMFTSI